MLSVYAAIDGNLKCLNLLIKAGARLDIQCGKGNTALVLTEREHHPECAEMPRAAVEVKHLALDTVTASLQITAHLDIPHAGNH